MSFPQNSIAFDNTLHSAYISVRPEAERLSTDTGKALLTSSEMPLRASIHRACYTSALMGKQIWTECVPVRRRGRRMLQRKEKVV
jgi:hypothetical protein